MIGGYPWDDTPFQDPESPARHPTPAPAPAPTHSSAPPPVHSLMKNTGMKVGYGNRSNDEANRGESRLVHVDGTLKATDANRYEVPQLPAPAPSWFPAPVSQSGPLPLPVPDSITVPVPAPSWVPVPVSQSAPLPFSLPLPVPAPITVPVPVPPAPTSTQPLNYFSLYWIKKSGLPCIRTDWTNVQVNLTCTALLVSMMWAHSLCMRMLYFALPCLALPCLALPCLALPCLALPCLALPWRGKLGGCSLLCGGLLKSSTCSAPWYLNPHCGQTCANGRYRPIFFPLF